MNQGMLVVLIVDRCDLLCISSFSFTNYTSHKARKTLLSLKVSVICEQPYTQLISLITQRSTD